MQQLDDAALLEIIDPIGHTGTPVPALVEKLKQADEDHEFYPTTDDMIRRVITDVKQLREESYRHKSEYDSVLDIGAGNGKVLMAFKTLGGFDTLHAIEKSSILCGELDPSILVVGTNLEEQSLLSKQVDVIFCNPPYSMFEDWAIKIIRECAAHVLYLIIPQRWAESSAIRAALEFRGVTAKTLGDYTFADAERRARAKVDIIRIEFQNRDDAFEKFFEEQFADLINKFKPVEKVKCDADDSGEEQSEEDKKKDRPYHALVVGPNYPEAMVSLYRQELGNVQNNYHLVSQLDADLLREFEIFPAKIMAMLKTRLDGLKNEYWMELFSHLNTVTDRLTSKSRQKLLDTLHKHVSVDFTVPNILEVVVWVIKNANNYLESQLIETYEEMVEKCNVRLYKSNKKVWVDDRWRYGDSEKPTHYSLDYRIVTHRLGGCRPHWEFTKPALTQTSADFFGDLLTIARNLGFIPESDARRCLDFRALDSWNPGVPVDFVGRIGKRRTVLFEARAFKNGNTHLRFNQELILAMNVEHGRLKGWLRTPKDAVEELQDPKAAQYFRTNLRLGMSDPARMLCMGEAA